MTSGDRPGWRLYKLSGVEIVELTETYTGPTREGYNPRDKRMKEIYSTREPATDE